MSYLEQFPDRLSLLESYQAKHPHFPMKVNNHIHTPYSFSAFGYIEEAVKMAEAEGVKILGINDFYVTEGYGEFIEKCLKHQIFPLLNVELIGISREDQEAGIRVNDPNNPGRTYISGKGTVNQKLKRQRLNIAFMPFLNDAQNAAIKEILHDTVECILVQLLNGRKPFGQDLPMRTV